VADSVKLAAIRDALDRAGVGARTAVEVEVGPPKPFEVLLERIEASPRIEASSRIVAGSRAEYRRSLGRHDNFDLESTSARVDQPSLHEQRPR
jgi:hypothetical protein